MIKKSLTGFLISLLILDGLSCTSYHAIKMEDAENRKLIDKARIMTIDGTEYVLHDVLVEETQISGMPDQTHSEWLSDSEGEIIILSTSDIKKIEIEKFEAGLTILTIIIVIGIPLGYVIYLLSQMED